MRTSDEPGQELDISIKACANQQAWNDNGLTRGRRNFPLRPRKRNPDLLRGFSYNIK